MKTVADSPTHSLRSRTLRLAQEASLAHEDALTKTHALSQRRTATHEGPQRLTKAHRDSRRFTKTHALTHSLTHSPTHSLTHSPTSKRGSWPTAPPCLKWKRFKYASNPTHCHCVRCQNLSSTRIFPRTIARLAHCNYVLFF